MDDPRRILEAAAESRCAVEVLPRGAAVMRGQVVRVERGGLVLSVSGSPPSAGTDLRCWLSVEGESWTFEASVLRSGVAVPDRSQGGVLLGFIDGWRKSEAAAGGLVLEALPPTGGPVSLTQGEVRLVDLHPDEWLVSAPSAFPLVFVEGGALRLRLGVPDRAPMEVGAEVRELTRSHGHLLYRFGITAVENPERYGEIVAALRATLGL